MGAFRDEGLDGEAADPERSATVLSRFGDALLKLVILILALHISVVLLTGGYTTSVAPGITIKGSTLYRPLILLLAAGVLYLFFTRRTRPWNASHEAVILFSVSLIIYLANGTTLESGDTWPARYLPLSILRNGSLNLDGFLDLLSSSHSSLHHSLRFVNGHYISVYPVAPALLALCFYIPSVLAGVSHTSPLFVELEKLSAAVIVALSAGLLYLILRRLTSRPMSLLAAVAYALGSSSLSTSSQALWQHGPSQLALTATLYCLLRGRDEPRWVGFAGFPLAFAVISRPTDVLIAAPLGAYVLLYHRQQAWRFLLGGLPPVLFQLWYNWAYIGSLLDTQSPILGASPNLAQVSVISARAWATPFWYGLSGILFSPGRGLFVYSPIFLFSVIGISLAWRKTGDPLLRWSGVGVLLVILLYSKWIIWWGGYSYGPRLLADLSPILALSLYPLRDSLVQSRGLRAALIVCLVWSVGAHFLGTVQDLWKWNGDMDIDSHPERLWSLTNNQLVNGPAFLSNRVHRVFNRVRDTPPGPQERHVGR